MHHRLPDRARTLNLAVRRASGSGKLGVLSQIEPQTPRLVVSFRQYLQVPVLRPYSPQGPKPRGFPGAAGPRPPPGRHRLGRGVKRYLIVVHPRAFALDQRDAARQPPALPAVPGGSSYFARPRPIPLAPRRPLARPAGPSSCAALCSGPVVSTPISSQRRARRRRLRALQLQQRKRRLSVMELPRLLAPCSPTNRSRGGLRPGHRGAQRARDSSSLPRAAAHWAICAPAASLRTAGRLSCPLSGAGP